MFGIEVTIELVNSYPTNLANRVICLYILVPLSSADHLSSGIPPTPVYSSLSSKIDPCHFIFHFFFYIIL